MSQITANYTVHCDRCGKEDSLPTRRPYTAIMVVKVYQANNWRVYWKSQDHEYKFICPECLSKDKAN